MRRIVLLTLTGLTGLIALTARPQISGAADCPSGINVNRRCVDQDLVSKLERAYGVKSIPGSYWYDARSGLVGRWGEPAFGILAAGLPLPGPMQRASSGGKTGVFFNGRELHHLEVAYLKTLGPVVPGRYWLDAQGNVGFENNPFPFANLVALGNRGRGGAGGGNYHGNSTLGTYSNSEGGCSYVMTPAGTASSGCD